MQFLVISHKQSSVHGQESFKTFIRSFRPDLCPPISSVDAIPSYLLFSTAGHRVGLRCLHIIASFFQHLSRICSLLCRRESQRNVVGVLINTRHHCQRPWHWCLVFLYQGAGPEGGGMKPGHQLTVAFVLILVTRDALSLTAFGDGDYYADVRGGESPS